MTRYLHTLDMRTPAPEKVPGQPYSLWRPVRETQGSTAYAVWVRYPCGKIGVIRFGDVSYEGKRNQTRDQWERYMKRAVMIRDKTGSYTATQPHSPNYWSIRHLWPNRWKATQIKVGTQTIKLST